MKYFRWEFIKRHINITHLISFSLGVIVICFLDALVFEKSIADWVSSTANVCMAGAALYAAFHANDWFKQKIHETGIKQIEKIVFFSEKILNDIMLINNNLFFINPQNIINDKVDEKFKIRYIQKNLSAFTKNNESLNKNCANFNFLIVSLSKFNIKINDDKLNVIKNYTECTASFTRKSRSFILEYSKNHQNKEKIEILEKSMKEMIAASEEFEKIKISELIIPNH
ncbi:hypothetical protein F164LOC_16465 [Pectobacterium carotovorum]|nr:hypothetical protein F164LOC_16465 [Pectobacterium carotovorum]